MQRNSNIHINLYIYTYMYIYTYINIYLYINMYIRTYAYVYVPPAGHPNYEYDFDLACKHHLEVAYPALVVVVAFLYMY
jgi:hypothetical protein